MFCEDLIAPGPLLALLLLILASLRSMTCISDFPVHCNSMSEGRTEVESDQEHLRCPLRYLFPRSGRNENVGLLEPREEGNQANSLFLQAPLPEVFSF